MFLNVPKNREVLHTDTRGGGEARRQHRSLQERSKLRREKLQRFPRKYVQMIAGQADDLNMRCVFAPAVGFVGMRKQTQRWVVYLGAKEDDVSLESLGPITAPRRFVGDR